MKWSKMPKEKRTHLVLVAIVTAGVLAGLGFGLIKSQYAGLRKLEDLKAAASRQLNTMETSIKNKEQRAADLAEIQKVLAGLEGNMATGDVYSWMINTVRTFRQDFPKVDMPQFGQATQPEDCNLMPKFPYKQVVLPVSSKAHYHDLGVFLSEFENRFPQIRVLNLDLKLNQEAANSSEKEKIAFTMDVVVLVKPTP